MNEIAENIEQIEDDIVQANRALEVTSAMVKLKAMPEFELVFVENFVKAYRDTAVVNIGLVKADAVQGISNGLIGRAHFENFVEGLIHSHEEVVDAKKQLEEALIEEKKLEQEEGE